jgi:hypothetical protein
VDIVIHGLSRPDGERPTPRTLAAAIDNLKEDIHLLERLSEFENNSP